MILKIKQNDSWRFIDGVINITAPISNEINPSKTFITYERNGEFLAQDVSQGCYLLNDEGKTIERLS
jgi:hypothetical protein